MFTFIILFMNSSSNSLPMCRAMAWVITSSKRPLSPYLRFSPPKVYSKFVIIFFKTSDIAMGIIVSHNLLVSQPWLTFHRTLLGVEKIFQPSATISSSSNLIKRNLKSSRSHTLLTAWQALSLILITGTGTTTSTSMLGYHDF